MVDVLEQLFSVIWHEEIVPRQWRDGFIVNIFKKEDREDPGNYKGITLLSVVGKVFCKILNNREDPGNYKGTLCFVRFLTIDWCSV